MAALETTETLRVALLEAAEEYMDLLQEEISELAGYAVVHGWESHRVEAGIAARAKIEEIKIKIKCQIQQNTGEI